MTTTKPVCGMLFATALDAAMHDTQDPLELFSWGHLVGQSEKVYLGACIAAMFRPGKSLQARFMHRMVVTCEIYGLGWMPLGTSRGTEFWIFRPRHEADVVNLALLEENSPDAHAWRGHLCGVPTAEIDREFHVRYAQESGAE